MARGGRGGGRCPAAEGCSERVVRAQGRVVESGRGRLELTVELGCGLGRALLPASIAGQLAETGWAQRALPVLRAALWEIGVGMLGWGVSATVRVWALPVSFWWDVKFSLSPRCTAPTQALCSLGPVFCGPSPFPPPPLRQPANVVGAGSPSWAASDGFGKSPRPPLCRPRPSVVSPPRLSRRPAPGPGPHSCGGALGLRAGAGEREGHRVLTGPRASGDADWQG